MEDTMYLPLDQRAASNEASKRRSLLLTSTTLALLLVLSVFWHPSALPSLQSCPAVLTAPPSATTGPITTCAYEQQQQQQQQQSHSNSTLTPPDHQTHPFPSKHTTRRTFHKTPAYSDLSPASDAAWTRLTPSNGGFILRPASSSSSAGTGTGRREWAGVSMFHQLHCLGMIRRAVQDMRAGRAPMHHAGAAAADASRASPVQQQHQQHQQHQQRSAGAQTAAADEEHWVHCLDYLVQAVLCAADDTVERAYAPRGGDGLVVDGYGVEHQCRDPARVWAAAAAGAQGSGERSRPGWEVDMDGMS